MCYKGEKMEQIDVLMATYNGEKYLREQIDSILSQTYQNIRLLISDDVSSDGTVAILKEYEKKDHRIVLFLQEKNLGYIKNFEYLMQQVENDIYMFSDQDDVWLPNKIEMSYQAMKDKKVDLVYTDLTVVDKDLNTLYPSFWKYLKIDHKVKYDDIRSQYLFNCVTGCTLISKKKFIQDILPLPYQSEFMPHDYWVALVVALKGKIAHLDKKTILYRQHGDNLIGSEKTSHKFRKFEQVRELFLRVKIEHFTDYVERKDVFTEEQNAFNEKCLMYFLQLKDKKYINFKGISIFHKLYQYDTVSYYLIQYVIMNVPVVAKFIFSIRYQILKWMKKR